MNGQYTVGDFTAAYARMIPGQVLHFTVKDPNPEVHKHQNSMVVYGQLDIVTGEYSTAVTAGQSAKFTPRAGLEPFPPSTVSTLTATVPTLYLCLTGPVDKMLVYEPFTFDEQFSLVPGTFVVPTEAYTLNGQNKERGEGFMAQAGDVLDMPVGTTIGVFTAV